MFIFFLILVIVLPVFAFSQTIGSTKTEQFKASFETKIDISQYMDYSGPTIPIQILKCGIGEEVYEQYPELKENVMKILEKETPSFIRYKERHVIPLDDSFELHLTKTILQHINRRKVGYLRT